MHKFLASRVFACIALVLVLSIENHAQNELSNSKPESFDKEAGKIDNLQINVEKELFRKLLMRRRKEHLEAVKGLQRIDSYERLYKMITILGEKMVEVIESSKTLIENSNFSLNDDTLPKNDSIKDAMSTILENIALFGDIVLHLPDITHRILKVQQKWNATIRWSLNFANQTRHLLDKTTIDMIHLVGQELNITDRESSYYNPHRLKVTVPNRSEGVSKRKSSKKKKRKKGPQMTKIEL